MPRRVVITGMGAVSPNGIGNEAFCSALLAGKSGVRRITRFDPSELEVQIAGEVTDFDESAWVTKHERKHVSRVVPLATAATSEALADAGIEPDQLSLEEKREIGVILGSGGGAQAGDILANRCAGVQAADRGRFPIHEGLHSQTHAVHAAVEQRLQDPRAERAGGALDGDFGFIRKVKAPPRGAEQLTQLLRLEQAERAAAEIQGLHAAVELAAHRSSGLAGARHVSRDSLHVSPKLLAGENAGSEVAIAALRLAEGNRDVESD